MSGVADRRAQRYYRQHTNNRWLRGPANRRRSACGRGSAYGRGSARGWPLFGRGLAVLVVGVVIAVASYLAARRDPVFYIAGAAVAVYGVVDVVRGLVSGPAAGRRDELKAPLSKRKPWLFAPPPPPSPPPAASDADRDADGTVEPGWYPDPLNPAGQRWWDGDAWTEETRAQARA
jgi:Protein of unknown function (DUF2510)